MKDRTKARHALYHELRELLWGERQFPVSRHYPETYRLYVEVAMETGQPVKLEGGMADLYAMKGGR